jgi:hypothetical protein
VGVARKLEEYMSQNPLNLAVRFLLEIVALIALGYWGWTWGQGALGYVLAVGVPVLAAVLWGVFAVPGDRSRSGDAPVPVPGWLRLLLELALFGFAVWGLWDAGAAAPAWILGGVVLLHYGLSYDRILWLLKH